MKILVFGLGCLNILLSALNMAFFAFGRHLSISLFASILAVFAAICCFYVSSRLD